MDGQALVPPDKQGNLHRADSWRSLVQRCVAKDESALSTLYDESCRYVHGVAWTILRDDAEAEEVTLDVYSQIWRNAAAYSVERGSVACWMMAMARNRAIDRVRSKGGPIFWKNKEAPLPAFDLEASHNPSPESSAAASERRVRIAAAVERLPAHQRRVVALAFFTGLTHSQLAQHLELPLGTVKGRLRAAMVSLRHSLEGKV